MPTLAKTTNDSQSALAATVKNKEDIRNLRTLVASACKGVQRGQHDVNRNSEFFAAAKRDIRQARKL